ncbi:MAG: alpha-N-arabinofuranosidase [Massilia sp.]|nr:alpha-N-arabinofuranosidase [Massilia sp.]
MPGDNSFTCAEDGVTVMLVYHARAYTKIVGDPRWNPNRHISFTRLRWDERGLPLSGSPSTDS